ncbi:hypothetical protein Tco_0842757 [Tanacetum coccineum]|uniref:Uncharacterized protein n=1 Tax=Tanacetum coccineum TaxID=301880 RepID=A0ABQ5B053_9ASTR
MTIRLDSLGIEGSNVVGVEKTECRSQNGLKTPTYHKEKMLLCKQAEKGVQLQAEQSDWLADTNEEIDEQELEAHYSYKAKIQEVPMQTQALTLRPLDRLYYDTMLMCMPMTYNISEQSGIH